ncbi:MAG: vWA domain-containing protein [Chloroflexota bacterium]
MGSLSLGAPAALWLLLAVPAILTLWMLRPRRQRQRVPSLMLWAGSQAERQSARPWQRVRNHPLLWLQIAAALALAAAAALPFLPAGAAGQHTIALLDASGSMRARDGDADRFTAAKTAVLDIARNLGPGQTLTVVRLDEQPRVLVAAATGAAQVEAALAGESPSFGPPDLATALNLCAGLTQGPADWVLVSDGGLALPDNAQRPAGTHFRFLPIGSQTGNVAVTGLSARLGESGITLQAGLRNTGQGEVAGRLQLYADGQLVGAQDWQIGPDAETYVTWTNLSPGAGWFEARLAGVEPTANALALDDQAWTVADANGEPAVLLVSDGNSFLEQVLSVQGNLRAFRTSPADWLALAQGSAYPLTILDSVWPEAFPAGSSLVVGPPLAETFQPREVWPQADHPLLRHVDWSEVRVATASVLPLDETWQTVIDSDGGPLLAIREQEGKRQAVLAFALGQSDLPLRPAFPVLMANLLEWLLARPDSGPHSLEPGRDLVVTASPLAQEVWVQGSQTEHETLAPPWPPRPFRPANPGLYRVVQEGEAGRFESLVAANGYHPLEADLTPRNVDLPAQEGTALPAAHSAVAFWPWLALLVLVISSAEWWLDARGR